MWAVAGTPSQGSAEPCGSQDPPGRGSKAPRPSCTGRAGSQASGAGPGLGREGPQAGRRAGAGSGSGQL